MANNNQQQNQRPQNYLFYSEKYCDHSKRIVISLQKNNLLDNIVLCNIDNQSLVIPPFITSVPTLYLSNERQILTDSKLIEWIDSCIKKHNNNELSMSDVTGDNNIFAFHQGEIGNSYGPGYAFIDDNANDMLASSFEMLDGSNKDNFTMPQFTRIDGAPQTISSQENQQQNNMGINSQNPNDEKQQRQNQLNKAYEDMMASRAAENANNPAMMRV